MKVVTGFEAEVKGAIFALDFVLSEKRRIQQRKQFRGFRDSAIFHRLWDLFGVISVPEARAKLSEEEKTALRSFTDAFDSLPWRPLASHPHVSELESDDLSSLVPSARQFSTLLRKRVQKSWWHIFSRN